MSGFTDTQIKDALNKFKGDVRKVAGALKVGLSTLYRRLEVMGENNPLRRRSEKTAAKKAVKKSAKTAASRKTAAEEKPETTAVTAPRGPGRVAGKGKAGPKPAGGVAPLLERKCADFITSLSPEIKKYGRRNVMDFCIGTLMRQNTDRL